MTDRNIENFWKHVEKQTGDDSCYIWTASSNNKGYPEFFWTHASGDYRKGYAHRFSYELHYGEIPKGLFVLHKCDNPLCIRPSHLWLGTNLDNVLDMKAKGRNTRGEKKPNSKLKEAEVLAIRSLSALGLSNAYIASRFEVNSSIISRVVHRKIWNHVQAEG